MLDQKHDPKMEYLRELQNKYNNVQFYSEEELMEGKLQEIIDFNEYLKDKDHDFYFDDKNNDKIRLILIFDDIIIDKAYQK